MTWICIFSTRFPVHLKSGTALNAGSGKNKKVRWKSGNSKIAAVSKGKITAKRSGTTVITASANGVTAKCKVKVINPTIRLSAKTLSVYVGKSKTLRATVKGISKKVVWKSSNPKIVKVTKGKIKGLKKGTAYIIARANGVTARCKVIVKKKKQNTSDLPRRFGYGAVQAG